MNTPFFSILIPTRNRTELLRRAVASVMGQPFGDFECIVAANDSNYTAHDILCREYADDRRFRLFEYLGPHLTMWDNWNRALSYATGRYCLVLPDKCILAPDALRTLAANVLPRTVLTHKVRRPATAKDVARIEQSFPHGPIHYFSSEQCYAELFRHYDRTDIFPHGLNMVWDRSLYPEKLFEPNNPDYTGGINLLNAARCVYYINEPIVAIPRDNPLSSSCGACVALGRPEGEEFLNSIRMQPNVLDKSFNGAWLLQDVIDRHKLVSFSKTYEKLYYLARYWRHCFDRARAGATLGTQFAQLDYFRRMYGWKKLFHAAVIAAGDLAKDVLKRGTQ